MWFLLIALLVLMLCDPLGRAMLLATISPIADIIVCVVFIFLLVVLLVCEIAMMVIAPAALLFGYDSRNWHVALAHKIMLTKLFGESDNDS